MKTLRSLVVKCLALFILFGNSFNAEAQTKLYLEKVKNPEKRKEVVLTNFSVHTYDGQFLEFEKPVIFDGAILHKDTSISINQIADIKCGFWTPGGGNAIGLIMMGGGAIGLLGSGISMETDSSFSQKEIQQAVNGMIIGILINAGIIYAGYQISGYARRYDIKHGKWRLVTD